MLQYKLTNADDLISFINNTPEFAEWEVLTCRFSTTNGLNIDMDTKVVDPSGRSSNIQLKFILPTINNFYQTVIQNNYSNLNIEVKMKLVDSLKSNFDPNDEYYGFYLDTYSDNISTVTSSSHLERSRDSGLDPLVSWDLYFSNLYQTWYNKYKVEGGR